MFFLISSDSNLFPNLFNCTSNQKRIMDNSFHNTLIMQIQWERKSGLNWGFKCSFFLILLCLHFQQLLPFWQYLCVVGPPFVFLPSLTVVLNRLTEAIIIFDGARKESKNEIYINIYFITITFARSYLYFDHHFDVARKESKSEIYESVSTPLCLDHHFISHLRPKSWF